MTTYSTAYRRDAEFDSRRRRITYRDAVTYAHESPNINEISPPGFITQASLRLAARLRMPHGEEFWPISRLMDAAIISCHSLYSRRQRPLLLFGPLSARYFIYMSTIDARGRKGAFAAASMPAFWPRHNIAIL